MKGTTTVGGVDFATFTFGEAELLVQTGIDTGEIDDAGRAAWGNRVAGVTQVTGCDPGHSGQPKGVADWPAMRGACPPAAPAQPRKRALHAITGAATVGRQQS